MKSLINFHLFLSLVGTIKNLLSLVCFTPESINNMTHFCRYSFAIKLRSCRKLRRWKICLELTHTHDQNYITISRSEIIFSLFISTLINFCHIFNFSLCCCCCFVVLSDVSLSRFSWLLMYLDENEISTNVNIFAAFQWELSHLRYLVVEMTSRLAWLRLSVSPADFWCIELSDRSTLPTLIQFDVVSTMKLSIAMRVHVFVQFTHILSVQCESSWFAIFNFFFLLNLVNKWVSDTSFNCNLS